MVSKVPTYSENLSSIWNDIVLLFKHFLHWNLSKIFLIINAWVIWLLVSMPLVYALYYCGYKIVPVLEAIKLGSLSEGIASVLFSYVGWMILGLVVLVFFIAIIVAGINYMYFLLLRTYTHFTDGDLPIFPVFTKALKIGIWGLLYTAFPLFFVNICYSIIFGDIALASGYEIFAWFGLIIGMLFIGFIYLRCLIANYVLLNNYDEEIPAKNYFQKSFSLVKMMENNPFTWEYLLKSSSIALWTMLYLLGPIAIFFIFFIMVGFVNSGFDNSSSISIILGILVILFGFCCVFCIAYICVRLIFAIPILSEATEPKKHSGKSYIQESFKLTKNKFWHIISLGIPFLATFTIISLIAQQVQATTQSAILSIISSIVSIVIIDGPIFIYYSIYRILKK